MTPREEQLFNLRNREYSLEECAYQMNCSLSTINRINKDMKKKIMKVI
uniref:RNA polymerase sigma-70 region 4 domain-containing protein n=1 Tax=Dulem virus 35 TaxID=3145753 RepID=A0AAU8B0K9_9CAUD